MEYRPCFCHGRQCRAARSTENAREAGFGPSRWRVFLAVKRMLRRSQHAQSVSTTSCRAQFEERCKSHLREEDDLRKGQSSTSPSTKRGDHQALSGSSERTPEEPTAHTPESRCFERHPSRRLWQAAIRKATSSRAAITLAWPSAHRSQANTATSPTQGSHLNVDAETRDVHISSPVLKVDQPGAAGRVGFECKVEEVLTLAGQQCR